MAGSLIRSGNQFHVENKTEVTWSQDNAAAHTSTQALHGCHLKYRL